MKKATLSVIIAVLTMAILLSVLTNYAVSAAVSNTLSEKEKKYDINDDGTVSISDVTSLLDYLSNRGKEEPEPTFSNPTFIAGKVIASAGSTTVQVPISIAKNPGIASIALDISYSTGLTLTRVDFNQEFGGSTITSQSLSSPAYISWVNYQQNYNDDSIFATLTFDVSGLSGEYSISVTYDEDNVYNINEDNIRFDISNGSITIK